MKLSPAVVLALAAVTSLWLQPVATGGRDGPLSGPLPVAASQASPAPPNRPEDVPEFEKTVRAVYDRSVPSIGMMVGPTKRPIGGGVIVSRDGHFLTHAHHGLAPRTPITIVLGDGRKADGKLLGVHRHFDLSLVKLDGEGPWPAVPLGSAAGLKVSDPCMALGYPSAHTTFYGERHEKGQPPLLRLGRVLGFHHHYVMSSCSTSGGDSGGPLLNLKGELIGTFGLAARFVDGRVARLCGSTSVDVFHKLRTQLLDEKVFTDDTLPSMFARSDDASLRAFEVKGPFQSAEGLSGFATPVHRSVVTVYSGDKQVALGLVVAADGWIVSRAKGLSGPLGCRFADGRKLEASVAAKSREHDLALLKVTVRGLVVAPWDDSPVPPVARVVASIGSEPKPLSFGVVCSSVESLPPVKGVLESGFPKVFAHDGVITPEQCGGPVVDATGKVIALNIATRILDSSRTYAIPAAAVRKAVDDLRKLPSPQ
jgi:S1-C subfamily serine protease